MKKEKFNIFEWDAVVLKNPEDVVSYVYSKNIVGKTVKRINVIGFCRDIGENRVETIYSMVRDCGYKVHCLEIEGYPYLDDLRVPWGAEACEPVQFVFEDGTTFEILLFEDGAKAGINSIPKDVTDGLNYSNFNSALFFSEIKGCKLEEFRMKITETKTSYTAKYGNEKARTSADNEIWENLFEFSFSEGYRINLYQSTRFFDWYRIEMNFSCDKKTKYSNVKKAKKNVEQIPIIFGRDGGGVFWISPFDSKNKELTYEEMCKNVRISIDEDYIYEFLNEFLHRYYDESIQKREEYESLAFDWYGCNFYTFESMEKMLADIRKSAVILKTDYDNPELDDIKKFFRFTDIQTNQEQN